MMGRSSGNKRIKVKLQEFLQEVENPNNFTVNEVVTIFENSQTLRKSFFLILLTSFITETEALSPSILEITKVLFFPFSLLFVQN